jgi:acetylornithine deacetylase/succinyl-diaminopimelate desuccinylase-like protein
LANVGASTFLWYPLPIGKEFQRWEMGPYIGKQNGTSTMVLSVQSRLFHSIDEHTISYIELWQQLTKQFSNTLGLPDRQQFLTTLAPMLHQRGLQGRLHSPQLLYAELQTKAPRTLLFYHYLDRTSSVADIVALLSAMDVCKNVLGSVPLSIQWLIDGRGITANMDDLGMLESDGCIYYHTANMTLGNDKTPILALATKGHLRVELEIQTASKAIDSVHGGIAPDALWRLLWALGTLKDAREDILIEGFYDTLAPVQDDMMAQLHALPDNTAELIQQWGIQQTLMGLQGFQLHYAHLLLPTCRVNSISNDPQAPSTANEGAGTLLSKQAKAQVDFYLLPDQDPQDIFSKLQRHLQEQGFSDVHVRILSTARPARTPASNPFIQLAISSIEKAYAQKPLILPTTVGSYANLSAHMKDGTPTIFIARNEQNGEDSREDFARSIKQIALLIEGMADTHATRTTE